MQRIALILVLLLALPSALEADCATARLELGAAIATGTRLPIGAPIVAIPENDWNVPQARVARELVGPRRIALTERQIAPDVTALVPSSPPPPGVYQVVGLREALSVEYTATQMPAALAAPELRSASFASLGFDRHAGERFAATAALASMAPSGAVLVLARWWSSGRQAGASFARVTAGSATQTIFQSAEGCGELPGTVVAPVPGASVDVAWVDVVGRVSPWSARVAIRR